MDDWNVVSEFMSHEFDYDPECNVNYMESIGDALRGLGFIARDSGAAMRPQRYFYEIDSIDGDLVGFIGKGKDGLWYGGHFGTMAIIMRKVTWRIVLASVLNREVDTRIGVA